MKSPIVRNLVAALAGYAAMFASLFAVFSLVWLLLGADGAFEPGSWEVSAPWVAASLVAGFAVAVLGGWVCAKLGANRHAIFILVALMIILAFVSASADGGVATGPRPADVPMWEAMSRARVPTWLLVANPLIGALGVLVGGRRIMGTRP